MNRPLHLAHKDARRLAGSLGLWLALFPLPAALLVLYATGRLAPLGPGAPEVLGGVHRVLGVAGFLLAVQLALEDPLHDVDAGWRTRPITLGDLLLAKLGLACAALVAAPTALLTLVWMAAGFAPRNIATLALDQAAAHTLLVGFGLLLGALTRNLGQALLWLVGSLAGAFTTVALLDKRLDRIADRPLLAGVFLILAFALWLIYRPRPSRVLVGGLGFVGAVLVAQDFFFSPAASRAAASAHHGPEQTLVAGSEARLGSERWHLARMEPEVKDPATLRLEWRRLMPHSTFLSHERLPPLLPALAGRDRLELTPRWSGTRSAYLAGLRFTRHELSLPAAECEGAAWRPTAALETASIPTP